eukprot:GFUD01089591.1.p1 GENE.GFUD01089591.1~~GFUD01089591.1.p1  ORF type:complete len:264 (+),score=44.27 GFUD01089591.1:26-793(+)
MGLLITVLRLAIYSGLMGVMMPMISMTVPNCCQFKYLSGPPDMEGNYTLIHPEEVYNDVLPEECRDSCVYTKQGNYEDQFCFEATDPAHSPSFSQCQVGPTPPTTAGLYTTSSPAKQSSVSMMTTTSTGQIPVEITTTPSGQSPVEITTTTPSGQNPIEMTTTTPSGQNPVEITTTPSGQSPVEITTTTPSGQSPVEISTTTPTGQSPVEIISTTPLVLTKETTHSPFSVPASPKPTGEEEVLLVTPSFQKRTTT